MIDDMRGFSHDLSVSFLTAARFGKQEYSIIIEQLDMVNSPAIDRRVVYKFFPEGMECPPSIWFD